MNSHMLNLIIIKYNWEELIDNKNKRTYANELTERNEGEEITIGGWLEDIRDIGSIIFGTIRDNTGLIQIIIKKENQDVFNRIKTIPRQSAMLVDGIINNSKAKDFKVEIKVSKIEIVSEAESKLPLDPTGRVNSSLDGRLDARALDLRNPNITAIFRIRHQAVQSIRESFIEQGFLEVTTPKIIGQAAEGGSTLFELNYFNDASNYIIQNWGIGLNDAIPGEIIKNLKIKIATNKKDPDKRDYFVSNRKIEKKGFKAKTSIEKGIKELINIFTYSKEKIINNY